MDTKKIEEFLSEEYKEYAIYSIENRAIASLIDGFKPVQRKIIFVADKQWRTGKEKTLKVFQLSGKVASDSYYHHGDMSLSNAIINMAQDFKNNAPLLEQDGQFGSLRSPEAGAPRYIGTKLSENFRSIYKDQELLVNKIEEGEKIEPHFYLPIIPTILINGGSGIAVGFSSNILNRDVIDVINECIRCLKTGKANDIRPKLNSFHGEFIQDEINHKRWIILGKYEKVNTTTLKITELPPSMTYEKYEEHLDKLIDNKTITSYDDNCKDNIEYVIKLTRKQLSEMDDEDIIKTFKLKDHETEIYNTLDETGKLKIFEHTKDMIEYFVKFRLEWYKKRKTRILNQLETKDKILEMKIKFIQLVVKGKIIINNKKTKDIIISIEKNKIEKSEGSYDYLLRMPINSLTKEKIEELEQKRKEVSKDLIEIKKITEQQMYMTDLKELKKSFQ